MVQAIQEPDHSVTLSVTVITDLLKQGIEMSDVRNMVGHSDSRTTELYDRREHEVTQNLVERISI